MKIVGLTGGIGSGKTTVAKMFEAYGIPVYHADDEAKQLMTNSEALKQELVDLLGEEAYSDGQLNRGYIAGKIFHDKRLLDRINAIVHPRVGEHFKDWLSRQESPYIIKEVAILFENGSQTTCDVVITVTAPIEDRIERIIARDQSTRDRVMAIMNNQWSDAEREELSDFVIRNESLEDTRDQVGKIHGLLLKQSVKS